MKKLKVIRLSAFFLLSSSVLFAADALVKYRNGVEKFNKGEYARAHTSFEEFIKENPYEVEVKKAWYYLARSAAAQKHFHEAISRVNITLDRYALHEDRVELKVLLGECLYEIQAYARAEKVLHAVDASVKDAALKYRLDKKRGLIAYSTRNFSKANEHLKSALRFAEKESLKDRELFEVYKALGKIAAKDSTRIDEAVLYLRKAITWGEKEKNPKVKTLQILARRLALRRVDVKNGLGDNNVADIRVDGDDVYIATWGAGLYRYSRSSDGMTRIALPSAQLRALYVDFDEIFIASFDGIYRLSKKSGEVTELKDETGALKLAQKIIKDDRFIYFTTLTRGLVQYDVIKKKVVALGKDSWVGSNQVYALDADLTYIVVGTLDHGAALHNKTTGENITLTTGEGGFKSANVKSALIDGRYVYFGTHDDGVYSYDIKEKKLGKVAVEAPFPSVFAKREHEIFIGTSGQGIRILDRESNRVEKLRAVEGLSANEVQIIRVEGDFLWIGYLEKGIDVLYLPPHESN